MIIHSYSQPSSDSGSDSSDVGTRFAPRQIKENGLLKECYCGARALIDTCHSTMDPGRRFFTCPNRDDGNCHIWKWWDEAIMEELTLMYSDYRDLAEKMEVITYLDDFFAATKEIDQLKEKQVQTEEKIVNLEMLVAEMKKKNSGTRIGFEMQIVVVAVVVLLALSIMVLFK